MKLIPYHRFEITSRLKHDEALAAIARHIEERKLIRWDWPSSTNDDRFTGDIIDSRFSLTRIMGYRNSFAPVCEGEIHDAGSFSRIVITMRPLIITILFCALFALLALSSLVTGSWPGSGVAMLVFLYLITMGGFWFEANKQEKTLREIFRAM